MRSLAQFQVHGGFGWDVGCAIETIYELIKGHVHNPNTTRFALEGRGSTALIVCCVDR